jgi:hypothetical protein
MANMSDAELIKIAQAAVPEHLKTLGRIVTRYDAPVTAAAATRGAPPRDDLMEALAKEVGAKLGKAAPDSADVEFVEHTPIGARSTVVNVRNGKVARVLKRA